ncbi:MAG: glycosyltransferase, partial [Methylobacteriaceae bacterium]|nr:glycosyltransferase [Methylobacteriaceae bacterium]
MRPILRFRTTEGAEIDRLLPGPVAGAAMWVGRVPQHTHEIWVSPTHHRGRFDFVIERARRRYGLALWLNALRRSPRYALSAAFYGVPRFIDEYDMNLDWALGFTPLSEFESWRRTRARTLDLKGIDAPRVDLTNAPRIHVLLTGDSGREKSLRSVQAQTYTKWQLHESRDLPAGADEDDLVFVLRAGDQLAPDGFAGALEHAARHPNQQIFYADETEQDEAGNLVPVFKPDWSPLLQAARPYLGRAIFARVRLLRKSGSGTLPEDLSSCIGPPQAFAGNSIGHIRRMLLTRRSEPEAQSTAEAQPGLAQPASSAPPALIVIPTKNRGDLLQKCVRSILSQTSHPAFRVVIVDNGS